MEALGTLGLGVKRGGAGMGAEADALFPPCPDEPLAYGGRLAVGGGGRVPADCLGTPACFSPGTQGTQPNGASWAGQPLEWPGLLECCPLGTENAHLWTAIGTVPRGVPSPTQALVLGLVDIGACSQAPGVELQLRPWIILCSSASSLTSRL